MCEINFEIFKITFGIVKIRLRMKLIFTRDFNNFQNHSKTCPKGVVQSDINLKVVEKMLKVIT